MNLLDDELVVVLFKYHDRYRWYGGSRDLWVLDYRKWAQEFLDAGYSVDYGAEDRFDIEVVNEDSIDLFLSKVSHLELEKDKLAKALERRFKDAKSWWDVGALFPIMFMDFDRKHVSAFYPSGTPMERYVPDGWTSDFIDFANEYPNNLFPMEEKFWVQNGVDMLKVLNERGSSM